MDDIIQAHDNDTRILTYVVDIQKCFDTIDHKLQL